MYQMAYTHTKKKLREGHILGPGSGFGPRRLDPVPTKNGPDLTGFGSGSATLLEMQQMQCSLVDAEKKFCKYSIGHYWD
jgi:hypothetical protein